MNHTITYIALPQHLHTNFYNILTYFCSSKHEILQDDDTRDDPYPPPRLAVAVATSVCCVLSDDNK